MSHGYPTDIFRRSTIEGKYKCKYCGLILRRPIQTYCGHRFCKNCFDLILSRNNPPICNACKEDGNHSILRTEECYPDKAIQRELGKYEVHCRNEGCDWTGVFKDYDQIHVDECPAEMIRCIKSGCETQVRRDDLAHHLHTECDMRVVQCEYCDVQLPYKDIKMHTEECDEVPVECPQCHKKNIRREELKLHLDINDGDCSKKMVPCEFEKVGCNGKVEQEKLKEHQQEYTVQHLQLLFHNLKPFLAVIPDIKGKFSSVASMEKMVEKQQQGILSLTTSVHDLETKVEKCATERVRTANHPNEQRVTGLIQNQGKKIELLNTKVTTYEGIVGVLSNEVEKEAEKLQEVEMSLKRERERSEALERKIKSQDRIIAMKDVALAEQDLRIQSLEMASYDGVLVWKISDFARKQQDAVSQKTLSIYSPCFFTSRHGYKMCARIYLNGDGMGKGNHISLFFVIMRGTFDGLLRWPFRQKVTLMLIDQNHREHVIDAFRPDPTSNSFKRPTHDMNIASGCPLFMPLSEVHSPRHAYVKDDVAYIKIIVDTTDID